jgi:hypothetical protein
MIRTLFYFSIFCFFEHPTQHWSVQNNSGRTLEISVAAHLCWALRQRPNPLCGFISPASPHVRHGTYDPQNLFRLFWQTKGRLFRRALVHTEKQQTGDESKILFACPPTALEDGKSLSISPFQNCIIRILTLHVRLGAEFVFNLAWKVEIPWVDSCRKTALWIYDKRHAPLSSAATLWPQNIILKSVRARC